MTDTLLKKLNPLDPDAQLAFSTDEGELGLSDEQEPRLI